jgi:antitoxin component of MazEF toxin-antitoxin module
MTHTQKIIKAGNSLAVTIPSRLVKTLGLSSKDEVLVIQKDADSITYKFLNPQQLTLSNYTTKTKVK